MDLDLRWSSLCYGMSEDEFRWTVNSMSNTLPTPENLSIWRITGSDKCQLCTSRKGTLLHILNNCHPMLNRYRWRHDLVLHRLRRAVLECIRTANSSKPEPWPPPIESTFVRPGQPRSRKCVPDNLLSIADDWRAEFDLSSVKGMPANTIPAEIASTKFRPDCVIFSRSKRVIILVELTCPSEKNLTWSARRKHMKYAQLVHRLSRTWTTVFHTVEVGSRGWVAFSMKRFLKRLGAKHARWVCSDVSAIARRCSYLIWLKRNSGDWNPVDLEPL